MIFSGWYRVLYSLLQIETACPTQGLEQCILQSKNFDAFGPIALNDKNTLGLCYSRFVCGIASLLQNFMKRGQYQHPWRTQR